MEQAVAVVSLIKLWEERSGREDFKLRDECYDNLEAAFLGSSQTTSGKRPDNYTYRPQLFDAGGLNATNRKQGINVARSLAAHHQASFARPPMLWTVPVDADHMQLAENASDFIRSVLSYSRIKLLQPRQSHWLSVRGDAIYGVDWNGPERTIQVRTYDPRWCYPIFDPDDPGGMKDLLVTFEVKSDWVEAQFGWRPPGKQTARCFVYWDETRRRMAVEDTEIQTMYMEHGLGCVPWRWCFSTPNNHLAQSDLRDVPEMQELLNDSVMMVMDAARKRIDKAYWGVGFAGDTVPEPGRIAIGRGPDAQIGEFPTADPPQELMGIISLLQNFIQAGAGISPISMEGMASGSIVTGSAVRHQVEAIEARMETRRNSVEQTYSILGTTILTVLEKVFPEHELIQQAHQLDAPGWAVNKPSWTRCDALYGGMPGLGVSERMQTVLQGLGRVVGIKKAVQLVFPDEDPTPILRDIEDYQLAQAGLTGRSQAVAQAAAQGQGQSQPAQAPSLGGQQAQPRQPMAPPPQVGQGPPPGAMGGMPGQVSATELETLLVLVKDRLRGKVYAVGELAMTGTSAQPQVAVEVEHDLSIVRGALSAKKVEVSVGVPKDEPKLELT